MWSVVQYRRLGRQTEQEWRKRAHDDPGHRKELLHQKQQENKFASAFEPESQDLNIVSAAHDQDNTKTGGFEGNSNGQILVCPSSEHDPIDPRNWSLRSRCKNMAILIFLVFTQGWAGAADSMANYAISKEFGVSQVAENLSQALYLFGVGTGCLFVGPLSETIGRNPTYLVSTFCYLLFVLGTALTPNYGGQVACRYFVGLFASATLGINGASVQDQFRPVKRAFVFPIIAWANVASRATAPIAAGWIISNPNLGWRWCEWVTLIISTAAFIIALLFLPETYLPVLLHWKAEHLRRVTGNSNFVSEHAQKASIFTRLKKTLPMSITFFSTEPPIAVLGGYMSLIYILLFSFLSGFDYIFKKTYGLSNGLTGSCFASIAAGSTVFALCAPALYSWARERTSYISGAILNPEFRLLPAMTACAFLPICLFWLGWTNYPSISIWSGLSACFVFGIVTTAIYVSTYEYIIDSYAEHGAVALASITMVRYLIAGGMAIAARPMYEGIGVHWTLSLLGILATILVPGPWMLYRYGPQLRNESPYAMHSNTG